MISLGAEKLREAAMPGEVTIGTGVDLDRDTEAKPAPVTVPNTDREGHIFTMGATRSGKTRLAEAMIEHDIRAGRSILWIDPKGDNAIFSKIVTVARETGREEDLLFFSPVFPRYSVKIDPLSHYFMPEEVVNHVVSGVRVRYVDPSVNVRNPLYDHTGKMISPAGAVNPFDYVSLSKSILVLREEQIEMALEQVGKEGGKPILILTDGDIRRASSLAGQPVYKASPFILKRLKIEKVPSLVEQEGRKFRVKEVVLK